MDSDYLTYVDPSGTTTRDYTQTPASALQSGLVSSGTSRSGLPIINIDNDAWTRQFLGGQPDAVDMANWAAVGRGPGGQSMAPSAMPATAPSYGSGVPGVPTGDPRIDAFNQAQAARSALVTAQNPLDYSSAAALAASQRTRAAQVAGGTDLFANLTGGTGPLVTSQAGSIASDISGGKKPATVLDTGLISDPRFRTLMATNPDNAKRFYAAVTGRDYDPDLAASQAQLTAQKSAQDKIATEVGPNVMTAPKDQPELGIKAGDYVKRVVQPGLIPGTVSVAFAPLSTPEKQAVGINPDGSIAPGSFFHRATGMDSIVDVNRDVSRGKALLAKQQAGQTTGSTTAAPTPDSSNPTPTWLDKTLSFGNNVATTAGHLIADPQGTVLNGGAPANWYSSPADIARMRANKSGLFGIFDNLPSVSDVMAEIGRSSN